MTQETELKKYAETIRCMSSVFDDIAAMLNLPKEQYGDPDALMDAIEALQEQALSTTAKPVEVEELAAIISDAVHDNPFVILSEKSPLTAEQERKRASAILSRYNVTKKEEV